MKEEVNYKKTFLTTLTTTTLTTTTSRGQDTTRLKTQKANGLKWTLERKKGKKCQKSGQSQYIFTSSMLAFSLTHAHTHVHTHICTHTHTYTRMHMSVHTLTHRLTHASGAKHYFLKLIFSLLLSPQALLNTHSHAFTNTDTLTGTNFKA